MYPLLGNNTTTNDENSSSQPHHPHLYDYNSPFLQDHDGVVLSYLLSQQQFLMIDTNSSQSAEISVAASNQGLTEEKIHSSKKKKKAAAPRKRSSGKKDRHSKICTAQGPRDRRMRLSVQIARKFFDLQDMLGFDKASKTIDWLFTKSKSAIKELKQHVVLPSCSISTIGTAKHINSLSTSTESNEVVSKTMQTHCALKGESSISRMNRDPKKNTRRLCLVGKGSRDEARARARDRTREKMRIRSSCQTSQDEANPKDLGLCFGEEAEKHISRELLEQGGTNSMMKSNADDHKTLMGRSISALRSRPSFEDEGGEFPGFTGNWATKMQSFHRKMTTNVIKSFTGNNVLQVENPSTPMMGITTKQQEPSSTTNSLLSFNSSNSQEQKYSGTSISITPIPKPNAQELLNPCSINFMPNQDQDQDHDHNPNSIFITTSISQDQNPGPFLKFN
ncbi:putative transcription factor TCP family [Rosa chinensis]|uniref:Putative transcription factor TCP family n=1 Tax=Rosa chinensis TaxID=74649 RepID=A0A2P6R1X6_ROSCH|nr:uncharacterized protein LOC112200776 [Rosa chinensis]PRQ40431.1 putative transcription factor TCP family [Rosa chinensis]